MASVRVRRGTEGPRHDPYGWTKIEFTRTDGTIIEARRGDLGYMNLTTHYPNDVVAVSKFNGESGVRDGEAMFQQLTGMSFDVAERMPELVQWRRVRAMSKKERAEYFAWTAYDAALRRYAE